MHFAGSEVQVASRGPPSFLVRKHAHTGVDNDSAPHDALKASVELGMSRLYSAVLLPADSRCAHVGLCIKSSWTSSILITR